MTVSPTSAGSLAKLSVLIVVPALLLLDAAIAAVRGAELGRLDLAIVVVSIVVLSCLVFALTTRAGRAFLHRQGDTLVYLAISGLVAWVAAEIIVAAFVYLTSGVNPFTASPAFHTRAPKQHVIFAPDQANLPGVVGTSRYTTNSLGLRGPEFPPRQAAYRILTVGGSTTECLYLDDTETWQYLLAERLNGAEGRRPVWIGSAGISGYPTVNHLKFVTESPLMNEVDALIFLIGANDFSQFLRGNLRDGALDREERTTVTPFYRYSPIVQMVRDRWQRRPSSMEAEDVVGHNIPRRRSQRQAAQVRDSVEGLEAAVRQYEARVEMLITRARSRGLRPILLTQPTLWDRKLSAKGRMLLSYGDINAKEYLSVEAGRDGIDQHNEALLRVCERMNAECVSTASMHGQESLYYDDFHFNEAGAAELARIVGDYLAERIPAGER